MTGTSDYADTQDEEPKTKWKYLWWVSTVIFLVWLGSGIGIDWYFGENSRGTIGDMFGAINALFSGLAFAGLIFAILMQREELKLQRVELRLARAEAAATRLEIEGQKNQAIAQNRMLAQQTFENTYFQMLRNHRSVVESLSSSHMKKSAGREVFSDLALYFAHSYNNFSGVNGIDEVEKCVHVSRNLRSSIDHDIGDYFRFVFGLVDLINSSTLISEADRSKYASLFIDQLSASEIKIIFYRYLDPSERSEGKPIIEKSGLLRNLETVNLVAGMRVRQLYSGGAYRKPEYSGSEKS